MNVSNHRSIYDGTSSSLTQQNGPTRKNSSSFGLYMVRRGVLRPVELFRALQLQTQGDATLAQILFSQDFLTRDQLRLAMSDFYGVAEVDLDKSPPSSEANNCLSPQFILKYNILPWRVENGVTLIATDDVDAFEKDRANLPPEILPVSPVLVPRSQIHAYVKTQARPLLTEAAATRVNDVESCRNWGEMTQRRLALILGLVFLGITLTYAAPTIVFSALIGWAAFTLVIAALLKTAAFVAHFHRPKATKPQISPTLGPLPKVSVLVPLFRETEIASALIRRLSRLTYPKALLDVVLVLEENDALTRNTLAAISLPRWMRVVEVPEGSPKTKPRAMNYALDFCDGDIIGIWDAEDAPHPDQIGKIAARFMAAPPDVACLQGILDYYNPRQNWLARCFTIEYATWFRLMLPGMSHLGLAIPLGGTTLFFRRDALEELGGWDAHNVTEDADLGFRLARHGYRTEMIETVTGEEANCHILPWIRQRSRWLKGYMVTYLVHMRNPRRLFRQLGPRQFWGFQAHFISALSQFFLAPFLWSFWLILFGLPHPLDGVVSQEILFGFGMLFLGVEVISIAVSMTAVSGPKHRHLLLWVPTLHFYYPLGVFAAYKALIELIFSPFYWDKTQHGHSLLSQPTPHLEMQHNIPSSPYRP